MVERRGSSFILILVILIEKGGKKLSILFVASTYSKDPQDIEANNAKYYECSYFV